MTKKSSTSALTPDQHAKQDKLYAEGHEYDYVIIGTGSSALTVGSLLANAGKKVCLLEYHDIPGGYAHTFKMGEFSFCAQIHYIWGCAPGGRIYEFLKRLGLEKDITFELFDTKGYDHMVMPDGKSVNIPYGWDKLTENIAEAYPDQREPVAKFLKTLAKIRHELQYVPIGKFSKWKLLPKYFKIRTLIKYQKATVQQLFDEFKLSKESQAVLIANAGNFMAPPNRLSVFMYAGLFGGYNTGAYYPTKHFKYYVDRLMKAITDKEGCHVYYETEVTKINIEGDQVVSVDTANGKTFKAKNFICNMDPQKAAEKLIGMDKFPKDYQEKLKFEYSPAGVVVYLGLRDIDLKEHGFGSFNTWHLNQWDMNKMWQEASEGNLEKPWIFMSTPTLHTPEGGTAPEGQQILEIATYLEYDTFKEPQDKSYSDYAKLKFSTAKMMVDFVEKNYIPELRKHIAVQVIGTPVTNEDFVMATRGNSYGAMLIPEYMSPKKLTPETPWKNFHWCNASSGWGGIYGTVTGGMYLYMDLTGDRFYKGSPSDDEMIKALPASH
jgi:phytoene dehydrogenase-like protein